MSTEEYYDTELGRLPETWEVNKLSKYSFKPQYGYTDSAADAGTAKYLRITDITDLGVNWTEVPYCQCPAERISTYLLQENDIVFARIGATTGKSYLISKPPLAVFASYLIRVRLKEGLFPQFLGHYLKTDAYWKQINQNKDNNLKKGVNAEVLSSIFVPIPPQTEQKKIAHVLSTIQKAIEKQDTIISTTTELKKALLQKLFTEGLNGEPQKETEIGLVPESWTKNDLEKTGKVVYGIQASVANNLAPIGCKILTNKNITIDGKVELSAINYYKLTKKKDFESILKKGDLLFNWRSGSPEHVGKTAYFDLDGEYTHSSFILRIRPNEIIKGKYLYYYLNHLRESKYFIKLHTYSINAKFNKTAVNALPVFFPKEEEQAEIAEILDVLAKKIALDVNRLDKLKELFNNLLHQLMTAQIRVDDIDFDKLDLVS